MSGSAEEALRAVVREFADEARTAPALADRALARGRRLRRRRRATVSAGALLAVASLAVPFLLLRPAETASVAAPEPVATVTPTPAASVAPTPSGAWTTSTLTLPGGWVLTGATTTGSPADPPYALDRGSGRYLRINAYEEVWAAPRGAVAAVFDYDRPRDTGLFDLRTGKVRWVRTGAHIMNPQWSADGSRLVLTVNDKDAGSTAIGVLTAGGAFRSFPVDTGRYFCTDHCFFTWGPDGREVAFQQTDPNGPRSEAAPHPRRGVQFFSADDGRPTRFVALRGDPAGPWSWSPDGRLVVLKGQDGPRLVEVATGRVLRTLPADDAVWVDDERLLYRNRAGTFAMVLADREGRELARQPLPMELFAMQLAIAPR